ncbi:MAG: hypothetical protein IJ816_03770 [Alloprevotella sp.]|nr:hypothetical protein [Alloprevotella sp.]
MTYTDITSLLSRFYASETTEAEEQQLKAYFASDDVPEELADEKDLFLRLTDLSSEDAEPSFDPIKIERKISQWQTLEKGAEKRVIRLSVRWISAAVAVIVLAVGLPLALRHHKGTEQNVPLQMASLTDTYDDPQRAAEEAQRALAKFSECLEKGLASLRRSNK